MAGGLGTFLAGFDAADAGLEIQDVPPDLGCGTRGIGGGGGGGGGERAGRGRGLHVEPGGERFWAGTTEEDSAHGGVVGKLREERGKLLPHSVLDERGLACVDWVS